MRWQRLRRNDAIVDRLVDEDASRSPDRAGLPPSIDALRRFAQRGEYPQAVPRIECANTCQVITHQLLNRHFVSKHSVMLQTIEQIRQLGVCQFTVEKARGIIHAVEVTSVCRELLQAKEPRDAPRLREPERHGI